MDDTPTHGADDTQSRMGGQGLEASASIGPYRLLQQLGEGGMGEVWLRGCRRGRPETS